MFLWLLVLLVELLGWAIALPIYLLGRLLFTITRRQWLETIGADLIGQLVMLWLAVDHVKEQEGQQHDQYSSE